MIKFIVSFGSEKKMKIKPQDLMENSVGELIKEKFPDGTLVSFDGTTAVVLDGKDQEIMVDPVELIVESAEKVIAKKLKTRKKLSIRVGK